MRNEAPVGRHGEGAAIGVGAVCGSAQGGRGSGAIRLRLQQAHAATLQQKLLHAYHVAHSPRLERYTIP